MTYKQIKEMSKEEVNQELCEKLGLCWHEPVRTAQWPPPLDYVCRKCSEHIPKNPDFFSDLGKVMLLREMMKRKDWRGFISVIGDNCCEFSELVELKYILIDGLLAKAALEWLRRKG